MLRQILLLESITHIEDLSPSEFIKEIESLKDKIVTEKLDGANLWFGVDEAGFFTSREGKSSKSSRFYDVSDYPMISNYNGFRAAHLALEKVEDEIRKHLQPGDMVEIEVLFGKQPNTVTYGAEDKNFIVILRGVNETEDDKVNKLADALNNKTVSVESTIVTSPDGDKIELDDETLSWKFTKVLPISSSKIDLTGVDKILSQFKAFLADKNSVLTDKSNEDVMSVSLTSIPKENREKVKAERDRLNAKALSEFKQPIKELLLSRFVRKIKPFLQSSELHPSEDIGVEGVVVRDPVTGNQTKIVDRDVFTAINSFNSSIRSQIAGLVRTTDQDAPSEMRGGVFGQAKIRIADLLGIKELSLSSGVKRIIGKFKKDSPESTAENFANSLQINNLQSVKTKVSAILQNSISEIDSILDEFKKNSTGYVLKLKTGKEIGISPEVMRKTLTSFAETKKEINSIIDAVKQSDSAAELIQAIYGKTINSLFSGGAEVKEKFELLKSISEQDAGGDGAAGANGSAAATTSSTSIAAYPMKLMQGKNVIKRARAFQQKKKFPMAEGREYSLLKFVTEEDNAQADNLENASNVNDTVQSKNDIEFKQLRNNVAVPSGEINQMDVSQYLKKAHEINDEVDSVIFGLEMDDGRIAKVYVNALQADEFEKALAGLLGKEDDIEKVINDLAITYDIIDVEWPNNQESNDGEIENAPTSDEDNADKETDDIDFTVQSELEEPEEPEEPEEDESGSSPDESGDGEQINKELNPEEEPVKEPVEEPEEDSTEDEDEDEEKDSTKDDEDEDEDEDEENPNSNKTKKAAKEMVMKTYGQQFKDKLLSEAKVKKQPEKDSEDQTVIDAREKFKKQMDDLLDVFPSKQDKAILTLMVNLGAPIKALMLQKALLRSSIEPAADKYLKNNSFRMWTKKLLASISNKVEESTSFDQRLSNKYQHLVYNILVAIGLPDAVEKTATRALLTGIRNVANMALEDSNVKVYLTALADELGVSDKIKNMSEPVKLKEDLLNEDFDEAKSTVMNLFSLLGFDPESNRSITSQANQIKVSSRLRSLAANTSLMSKFEMLNNLVSSKMKVQESTDTEEKWILGKLGTSGVMMQLKGLTIKLSADEAQKMLDGFESKSKFSVMGKNSKRFEFSPHKKDYMVTAQGDSKFPEGLKLHKSQINDLIDMINEE